MKRKELLSLPCRQWDVVSFYDNIYIVPTRKKHESGYRLMAVVGMDNSGQGKICAFCDDINCEVEVSPPRCMRIDMEPESNCCRFWGNDILFVVGVACSSTTIYVKDKKGVIGR